MYIASFAGELKAGMLIADGGPARRRGVIDEIDPMSEDGTRVLKDYVAVIYKGGIRVFLPKDFIRQAPYQVDPQIVSQNEIESFRASFKLRDSNQKIRQRAITQRDDLSRKLVVDHNPDLCASERSKSDTRTVSTNIKRVLKARWPGVKFSVRIEYYAGGSSANVRWTDGPTQKDVDRALSFFAYGSFDSSTDSYDTKPRNLLGDLYGTVKYVSCDRDLSDAVKKLALCHIWAEELIEEAMPEIDPNHEAVREFGKIRVDDDYTLEQAMRIVACAYDATTGGFSENAGHGRIHNRFLHRDSAYKTMGKDEVSVGANATLVMDRLHSVKDMLLEKNISAVVDLGNGLQRFDVVSVEPTLIPSLKIMLAESLSSMRRNVSHTQPCSVALYVNNGWWATYETPSIEESFPLVAAICKGKLDEVEHLGRELDSKAPGTLDKVLKTLREALKPSEVSNEELPPPPMAVGLLN